MEQLPKPHHRLYVHLHIHLHLHHHHHPHPHHPNPHPHPHRSSSSSRNIIVIVIVIIIFSIFILACPDVGGCPGKPPYYYHPLRGITIHSRAILRYLRYQAFDAKPYLGGWTSITTSYFGGFESRKFHGWMSTDHGNSTPPFMFVGMWGPEKTVGY